MSGAVVLIGLSGSGKTTVGRLVARVLAVPFADTDDLVIARVGKPVHRVFAEDGEEAFRDLETGVIVGTVGPLGPCVVATGGGALLRPANRATLTGGNFVVWLDAPSNVLASRLAGHAATPDERPLLSNGDPAALLAQMATLRAPLYAACASLRLDTAGKSAAEVAAEVVAAVRRWRGGTNVASTHGQRSLQVSVPVQEHFYPIITGWGVAANLGGLLRDTGLQGRPLLFLDAGVEHLYGEMMSQVLSAQGGASVARYVVPAGEQHKTLAEVERAYTWLAERRAERGDVVLAVGGGKTGDLVGFVAATYLRGMRLVQVPTTLLAQVDSSLGGKVGVDLPAGKNLVGAFHNPSLVVADFSFLRSLPRRELSAGYAEVVKHGLIADPSLFAVLEAAGSGLLDLPEGLISDVVPRAMAVKVEVVQDDLREAGRRAVLNYGHSVGHALEVVTGYRMLLHGEAIAFGMVAAAALSCRLGLLDPALAQRQNRLLRSLGLLGALPAVEIDDVINALGYDKKVQEGRLRWVLLRGLGDPLVTADVSATAVREAVGDLLAGQIDV